MRFPVASRKLASSRGLSAQIVRDQFLSAEHHRPQRPDGRQREAGRNLDVRLFGVAVVVEDRQLITFLDDDRGAVVVHDRAELREDAAHQCAAVQGRSNVLRDVEQRRHLARTQLRLLVQARVLDGDRCLLPYRRRDPCMRLREVVRLRPRHREQPNDPVLDRERDRHPGLDHSGTSPC